MINIQKLFLEDYKKLPLLAIVPILGSTKTVMDAFFMAVCFVFVSIFSFAISYVSKKCINDENRFFCYLLITSAVTTILCILLQIYMLDFYLRMKIYIMLISVSVFMLDIFDIYSDEKSFINRVKLLTFRLSKLFLTMVIIAMIREFFGNGSLLGHSFVSEFVPKILIMQTQAGAYFVLAFWFFLLNLLGRKR